MSELKKHVLGIVRDIENGYKVDDPDYYDQDYQEGDILSGYDYLADVLDIEYIVTSKGEYLGARILVTFGGPNIWINTRTETVEGYWWSDTFRASFYSDSMGIDEVCRELWECR